MPEPSSAAASRASPASRLGFLRRTFARLSFRTKFIIVGIVVAGPLCVLAGFAAASFDNAVQSARARALALEQSDKARSLMLAVALHRGLSARVLAGGEGLSTELVAHQTHMVALIGPMIEAFSTPEWTAIGLPDPGSVAEELRALMLLPDARQPARNFERHNEVIDALLAVVYRTGNRIAASNLPTEGGAFDMAFVTLPALMEDLGRQRGWGSAVLQEQGWTLTEIQQHLMYAGAARQRLTHTRADRHTLREIDTLIGQPGQPNRLVEALNEAEAFNQRSIAAVLSREGGDEASQAMFREGSNAIEALNRINRVLAERLQARTAAALSAAERGRLLSVVAMGVLVLVLAWIYREFERSTVLRLRSLQRASGQLARGDFEDSVPVEGSDEIANLAQALDAMRQRLRDAVASNAMALAAQESDRAKTDFLARWSHDLRTPLTAVLGFARLLGDRDDGHLSSDQRTDLAHIRTAGQHLLDLVNDVLEIARVDARHVVLADEALALSPLVQDAIDLVGPAASAQDIQVHHGGTDSQPWVRGDRTRLLQVLANLLGNAIKFNRRGGEVRIALGHDAEGRVEVAVIDTGIGIAPEQLPRLFQPFERLDAQDRGIAGTGLGLVTVKRLVEGMGGSVSVSSQAGVGSRFTVVLRPGRPEDAAPTKPVGHGLSSNPAQPLLPRLRGRVAYVEDNAVNLVLMQAMLHGRTQIELVALSNGAQALADPGGYDLWIVDHQLPDTDGVSLLHALRQRHGDGLRAVMFSADALPVIRERALAAGYLDFWTKPLELDALLASLRRVLPSQD
jgi:signal transduction histidine kinase